MKLNDETAVVSASAALSFPASGRRPTTIAGATMAAEMPSSMRFSPAFQAMLRIPIRLLPRRLFDRFRNSDIDTPNHYLHRVGMDKYEELLVSSLCNQFEDTSPGQVL